MARPPVLALRDVRLMDGPLPLFDGVDLGLEPRARAALVGRNGAGKSTLLRMLAGRVEPDSGERFANPGLRIALVPQEPSVDGKTLLDFATACGAAPHDAEPWLATFGLDPARPTTGLSGGEARRAALARAFAEEPDVLLLDEPTNHLDILAIADLEQAVAAAKAAILLISHDRAFLERVTRQTFWLDNRRIQRLDQGFAAFEPWADQIREAEVQAARRLDKELQRENHWLQRGVTARRARNEGRRRRLLQLRADKTARLRAAPAAGPQLTTDTAPTSGKLVAELKSVSFAYPSPPGEGQTGAAGQGGKPRPLLRNFSTRILRGDRLAIVGPNGAGKTTLINLLLGRLRPDEGAVRLGTNLQIAHTDQLRAGLTPDATLWDTLAPDGGDQIDVRGRPQHVAAYAKAFAFSDRQLRQPVASLSGGERNRLLLAVALAKPANLLVLDEPTNDLDMDTLDALEDALADYDGTLILVSHDRDFVDRLATSTIALNGQGGAVETPGGWQDFLSQNPGFFEGLGSRAEGRGPKKTSPQAQATSRPSTPDPRPPVRAPVTKLTYRDARRLTELETELPRLADQIADLERPMADSAFYTRDPAGFDRAIAALDAARDRLAAAEDEWLALEERREALAAAPA